MRRNRTSSVRHWFALIAGVALASCGPTAPTNGGGGDGDGGSGGGGTDSGTQGCQGAQCNNNCPAGQATTLSGVVKAPNGIDPVPGALVYVPREVTEFPGEVRCEVCSSITDNALVATTTNDDGSFTLGPLPTAENQPPGTPVNIVAQIGRFRRLASITIDTPCGANTAGPNDLELPGRNDGYNNIPSIAVGTGDYDVMECVLLKLGLEQGSFDLYNGINDLLGGGTPNAVGNLDVLLQNLSTMKQYNIIFLNCANDTYENLLSNPTIKSNIDEYVSSGGRLYVTDWSYDYIEQVDSFSPIIDFGPDSSGGTPEAMNAGAIGTAGITTEALVMDDGMRRWLEAVEAVTGETVFSSPGRVHIEHFLAGWVMQLMVQSADNVVVWLTGQVEGDGASGDLPLTTTFDHNQCGRVLYSSYHTLGRPDPPIFGTPDYTFPNYCASGPLSPQERVLEYLIWHIADCIAID